MNEGGSDSLLRRRIGARILVQASCTKKPAKHSGAWLVDVSLDVQTLPAIFGKDHAHNLFGLVVGDSHFRDQLVEEFLFRVGEVAIR